MKQILSFLFSLVLWVSLSACLPLRAEPSQIVVEPTLLTTTVGTTAVAFPSPTQPTATPTVPTSTATAVPGHPNPVLTTQATTNVRLGPGPTYGVAFVLPAGTTTSIVGKNLDSTWWYVSNQGLGVQGWVSAAVGITQGNTGNVPFMAPPTLTPTPKPPAPSVPVMGTSGPPPGGDVCVAAHPGPGSQGPLYLHQFPADNTAVTAELGLNRWAAIKETKGGWYLLEDLAGLSGWAHQSELAFTCPLTDTEPQRIQFEPGAISAIVDGELHPSQRDAYLFRAMAGQMAIIEIHSTADRANFTLSGVDDGHLYKPMENAERLWSMNLPLEQDYLLVVLAPADAPVTEYSITLTIAPLNTLPPPPEDLEIEAFAVTAVDLPDNGKQLTFHWSTVGGTSARILSGTAQRFQPVWDVPLSGELTVDLTQTLFRNPVMTLELSNEAGEFIVESVIVDWNCTNPYFFAPEPRRCPQPATAVPAAIQPFERGWMVWLESIVGNNQRLILTLYDDGALQTFTDTWEEGDPVDDPALAPPPGLFQPVRGFGKVWREESSVQNRLGWATNTEQAFQATWQAEMVESIPVMAYLQLPDGRILYLPLDVPIGTWEEINKK